MGRKDKDKEAITPEYLVGESSYRRLGIKYELDFRIVNSLVMKYYGRRESLL